ncbi:MAG: ethylbenzene dehydrogenase [Proteobacteria bacterium]|nr:ethylbenzene dehydrogenase [Pseudomonadota bacterium]MBU1581658.1 ethylbenzene dehydrogenase [Pseudomonadota bacterium]MBU2629221.1 ethylbenzene dehydrogenase [Pseudomonadota bacterium]
MKTLGKLFLGLGLGITGMLLIANPSLAEKTKAPLELVSVKADTAITLDAMAEKAWDKATALEVKMDQLPYEPDNGYGGIRETTATIKSLYDDKYVYFFLQYADPTQSFARFPWVKQTDGTWKQLKKKDSTGHDNTYYEDKVGFYWEIKAKGFKKKGCAVSCHMTENGLNNGIADTSAGRKYTNSPDETIDMWHWKSVRTGPLGFFDDQFVDSNTDPKVDKNWGRHGDVKTGGGYKDNINEAKTGPAFMNSPYSEEDKYWVLQRSKAEFVDMFKSGDIVPGIVISPFTGGHRADITVKSAWKDGMWTLEIKRALTTSGDKADIQDVQFSDLGKVYYFGLSVFDNSQINHVYHEGSIGMTFK